MSQPVPGFLKNPADKKVGARKGSGNSRFIKIPAIAPSMAICVTVLVLLLAIAFPFLNTCSLILFLSFEIILYGYVSYPVKRKFHKLSI